MGLAETATAVDMRHCPAAVLPFRGMLLVAGEGPG